MKPERDRRRRLELLERKVALEDERSRIDRARSEVAADLGESRPSALDSVRVASPCTARWDDMAGDERRRFCTPCGKEVFDLSAMTRSEAEAFLATRFGRAACIRLFRRPDGTVITSDCTAGHTRARKVTVAVVAAGVAGFAWAAVSALTNNAQPSREVMGVQAPIGAQAETRATSQAVYK